MLFNSYIFILFFLPVSLIGYFGLNKYAYGKKGQAGLLWLFLMSLWFYGYEKPVYLVLILSSILVNFLLTGEMTRRKRKKDGALAFLLSIGLIFNIGLLFYFKYYNFFLDNVYRVMGQEWEWRNIFLPLGISFFTFQQLSYVIDCYRQKDGISYSFVEYAAFVSFFPQLVAGPIVMHSELIPQFRDESKKKINFDYLAKGLYGFALGLGKKVLIADTLSRLVTAGFADVSGLNSGSAWVVMLAYTLQIYFDFSGYSDMALGMAAMFNMELPINFNSPYKSRTIGDLAHDFDQVFYPVCLHSSGRKSKGKAAYLLEYDAGISAQRSMAWSQLDLRFVGRTAWCFYDPGKDGSGSEEAGKRERGKIRGKGRGYGKEVAKVDYGNNHLSLC